MKNERKPYGLIEKREKINKYLEEINVFEKEKMFQKVEDIFYVYNLSTEEVKNFLASSGNLTKYTDEKLLDFEGALNAILFHIKYRRKNFF